MNLETKITIYKFTPQLFTLTLIGVIPEEEGRLIKDILDMGWNKLFKAVISQNDSTKPLENRFKVAVYIKQK